MFHIGAHAGDERLVYFRPLSEIVGCKNAFSYDTGDIFYFTVGNIDILHSEVCKDPTHLSVVIDSKDFLSSVNSIDQCVEAHREKEVDFLDSFIVRNGNGLVLHAVDYALVKTAVTLGVGFIQRIWYREDIVVPGQVVQYNCQHILDALRFIDPLPERETDSPSGFLEEGVGGEHGTEAIPLHNLFGLRIAYSNHVGPGKVLQHGRLAFLNSKRIKEN